MAPISMLKKKLAVAVPRWQPEYEPVPPASGASDSGDEETKGFISGTSRVATRPARNSTLLVLTGFNIIALIASCTLFGTWFYDNHLRLNPRLRHAQSYTPVMDRLDLSPSNQIINGTLFPSKHPGIGRQMPNKESDDLWKEWELTRVLPVTAAQIRAMGKDPETAVKLEDRYYGLGEDAYAAIFDVYHQLHCVNTLRQIAYGGYYHKPLGDASNSTGLREIHINHCVDILVQAIQCSGNLNLITLHWVETQDTPYPDMSINRQCVAFDSITDWRYENTIDMDVYYDVTKKPKGQQEILAPDDFFKYFGAENPHKGHDEGDGL